MSEETPRALSGTIWAGVTRSPILSIFAYAIVFGALAVGLGTLASEAIQRLGLEKSTPGIGDVISAGATAIAAVCAFWIVLRFLDKRPWPSGGYAWRGVVTETVTGYLIGMSLLSMAVGAMYAFGVYHPLGINRLFRPAMPLLLFFFAAVVEETVFRGYVFQSLERRFGTGIALIATAGSFGLAHLINPVSGMSVFEKVAGPVFIVFEAGIILCAAYILTRRLWLPIGIHWAWNFFEGPFYGTTVSGLPDSNTFFRAKIAGPFLLTGGAFWP